MKYKGCVRNNLLFSTVRVFDLCQGILPGLSQKHADNTDTTDFHRFTKHILLIIKYIKSVIIC